MVTAMLPDSCGKIADFMVKLAQGQVKVYH